MIEQLQQINDRINAERLPATAGAALSLADREDLVVAKYRALHDLDINAEVGYCLAIDGHHDRRPHWVCVIGMVVLDDLDPEVRSMDERHDLIPIYAINGAGLRNWNSERRLPPGPTNHFVALVARLAGPSGP